MIKNIKSIFFILTLVILLVTVGAVCAADDNGATNDNANTTTTTSSISEKTTTTEPVVKEKIENTPTKQKTDKTQDKTITKTNKTQKNTKTTTRTIEVTNTEELVQVILDQVRDNENEEYIINLKQGTYTLDGDIKSIGAYSNIKKVTYNGNNSIINCESATVHTGTGDHELVLKDLVLNGGIDNEDAKLTVINCTINADWVVFWGSGAGVSIFNDDCTLNIGDEVWYQSDIIYTNDTVLINKLVAAGAELGVTINPEEISYNKIIENTTITTPQQNNINLTYVNCQMNAKITNNGNLTLINCSLSNNNMTTSGSKTDGFLIENNGNLTMIDCVVENNTFNTTATNNVELYGAIVNNGMLTVINSSFRNNSIGSTMIEDSVHRGRSIGGATCISNNKDLSIDNSTFDSNHASTNAGAIYNNNAGTLIINNCEFINNTANSTGGALVLNGIYNITNTKFTSNQAIGDFSGYGNGWGLQYSGGAIHSDSSTAGLIKNSTFTNNSCQYLTQGMVATSTGGGAIKITRGNLIIDECTFHENTAEYGAAINNGYSNYWSGGGASNNLTITNSIFIENKGQKSAINPTIIDNQGFINLNNNTFIENTDASYLINNGNYNLTDNTYINNTLSKDTIYTTSTNTITTNQNTYTNTTIDDTLTLDIPNKIFENEEITITGTYQINNPQNYDQNILEQNKFQVYINGVLTYTLDEISFNITPTPGNMLIIVQPTISQTRSRNMLTSTKLAVITPENYDNYIIEGELLGIAENSQVSFAGNFTDKGEIYINTANIILNGENATFTNTTFTLDKPNITIENMKITNTNTTYPIKSYANNNTIQNNNITISNTIGETAAIYTKASNTQITNNTLKVTGPAGNIDWESDSSGICTTQAILAIESENNTITYNNITVNGTTTGESFGTIEGITNSRKVKNSLIAYNNITVTGGYFNYAINQLDRINNSTVTENNILVTGFRYADGIQIGDNATNINITKNNITCICLNDTPVDEAAITYGIITTCQGGEASNNFTINENNINLTGAVNYGMEIYQTTNTQITNNNITANGNYSMGIGLAHSPNSNINENIIKTYGDSTTSYTVTEEIQPANVGIKVQQNSNQVNITNNTIITNDENQNDKTIDTDSQQTTITNNQLISSNGYGQNTIKTTQPDTSIENNIVTTTTTINVPETIITKTPAELTATVTIDETPINGGLITFTKDNEVLAQSEVIDGVATTTVTFKEEEDATIIASYTPESTGLSTSSAEATTSIQAPVTQLNIEDVNLTSGETVTLTATVTDQAGNNITGGKIIFKVNGKTVKDTNGKVIYAKVVDGVASVEYIVPDNLSGKDVNITAVYSGSSKYNKESTTITKTATAQEPTLTITPITDDVQTGSTITLKAKIAAGDKAITTGKIVFKINGKTVKDANGKVIYAKVDANGEVSVDYNLGNLKAGSYTIEATFISPGKDKITSNTSMTVVKA